MARFHVTTDGFVKIHFQRYLLMLLATCFKRQFRVSLDASVSAQYFMPVPVDRVMPSVLAGRSDVKLSTMVVFDLMNRLDGQHLPANTLAWKHLVAAFWSITWPGFVLGFLALGFFIPDEMTCSSSDLI